MSDWQDEFKAKLKQAEQCLQEAETIAVRNGIKVPVRQPSLENCEKIKFPRGYIRIASEFRKRYELSRLISDTDRRSNIAYALQATDFLNYLLNRFSIGLSVERVLYRIAIAHVVSIIEALIYGAIDSLHRHCVQDTRVCNRSGRCHLYIKSANKYTFRNAIDLLKEKDVLPLSDEEQTKLLELKEIRDRIHIWDADGNEFLDHNFALREYNSCIRMLATVRDHLKERFANLEVIMIFECPKQQV